MSNEYRQPLWKDRSEDNERRCVYCNAPFSSLVVCYREHLKTCAQAEIAASGAKADMAEIAAGEYGDYGCPYHDAEELRRREREEQAFERQARAQEEEERSQEEGGAQERDELEDIHSTLLEILSTLKSRTDFSGLFWVGILILVLSGWSGSKLDRWTDQVWYSFRYDADLKNITVEKRPSDCDFFHAPLGSKGCQYEKRTNVFGAEQRRALIQQATTIEEKQAYEKQPNSVSVYWEKEEE